MLQGRQQATLRGVKTFEIHGQTYYDFLYELEGGERGTGRVATEVIYPDPREGDQVLLHFLMGMVTQVERVVG